jgi:hypothetical protein
MKCPKIELGIIIARLRRLLVAIGHVPIGRGVGKGGAEAAQQRKAASNNDNCPLHGRQNRVTKSWPQ